jgi:RecA/RadA recombinase
MSLLQNLKKEFKNDTSVSILDDGLASAEFDTFIDTGSYSFNAVLSASIFNGFPDNKVLALAGEEATGKTFFALAIVKRFLDANPNSIAIVFDTESATTKKMMAERGIDPSRVMIFEPETVQEFKTKALKVIETYTNTPKDERPRVIMLLDSLGQLSTNKEMEDSAEGKDTRDMTRTQQIKGAFRTIRLKLAKVKIPLIVTNHIYSVIGSYIPAKEMSGGTGLKYAADYIMFLTKKADRDENKITKGNIITVTAAKSRLTKEKSKVQVLVSFNKGLDKYYGLFDIAVAAGIFTKKAKGYEYYGKTVYEKDILANPENYYTPEVLKIIDEKVKLIFEYGHNEDLTLEEELEEEVNE